MGRESFGLIKNNCRIFAFFLCFFLITLTNDAHANFACGIVLDSDDNMSASWNPVRIYYNDNISKYVGCDVSPSGNKYCCDSEAIPGKAWKIGNSVNAEVYSDRYVAGPVSLVSSGEGFDVFPEMKLKRVIDISNMDLFYLINESENNSLDFIVEGEAVEPYTNITYSLNDGAGSVCENCTNFSAELHGEYGMNRLRVYASGMAGNEFRVFDEERAIVFLENISLEKEFVCERCEGNRVGENSNVSIRVKALLSHNVEGLKLVEYVPNDWEILDSGGGIVMQYSSTHRMIFWNVSGLDFERDYAVKAPNVGFLPIRYVFMSSLEDYFFPEEKVLVYGFWPFFSSYEDMNFTQIEYKTYSQISPKKPLVASFTDMHLKRIGVYPKTEERNIIFEIRNYSGDSMENGFDYYSLETSLNISQIDRVVLEFSVGKKFLENNGFSNVSVYSFWDDTLYSASVIEDNSKRLMYRAVLPSTKGFAFVGVRADEGIFDALWRDIMFWNYADDEYI